MSKAETLAAGVPAGAPSSVPARSWKTELGATAKLAVPLALAQLGQIAMLTTDVVLIGRMGADALAAASLGMNLFFAAFILGMGVMTATAPLAAQAHGARDPRGIRRTIRMGLWAGLLLGAPFSAALAFGEDILLAFGQAPALAALAGRYLDTLLWCTVPALWIIVLRNFVSALNRPRSAAYVMLGGIALNGVLVWALVFGRLGLPEMGIAGAGLATTIVQFAMVAVQLAVAVWGRPFRRYRILGRFWRADWPRFRRVFALGLPISAAFMLEAGVFIAAVFVIGVMGTVPLAAHQIAVQIASVTFMVPFGIAQAATVRVGHAVGAGDRAGRRRAGMAALVLGVGFMLVMAVLLWVLAERLAGLFIGAEAKDAASVVALAATLLVMAALFQVFDGAQSIAMGALRGMNDTHVPMFFAAISYWGVGFSLAYVLGVVFEHGALGVWIGLAAGLAVAATLLVGRFFRLTR
jgi:MATE family multidrug resistance protein